MLKIITAAAAIAITVGVASTSAAAGSITTTCRTAHAGAYMARACETVITRDPEPAAVDDAPSQRGAGTTEVVRFDPADEARKARIAKHDPASINLCPAPWHYDRRDGCQR